MVDLPARFCEICSAIHEPPIHDIATCYPGKHGWTTSIYWTKLLGLNTPEAWPTADRMKAQIAFLDAVFTDKGTKAQSH